MLMLRCQISEIPEGLISLGMWNEMVEVRAKVSRSKPIRDRVGVALHTLGNHPLVSIRVSVNHIFCLEPGKIQKI